MEANRLNILLLVKWVVRSASAINLLRGQWALMGCLCLIVKLKVYTNVSCLKTLWRGAKNTPDIFECELVSWNIPSRLMTYASKLPRQTKQELNFPLFSEFLLLEMTESNTGLRFHGNHPLSRQMCRGLKANATYMLQSISAYLLYIVQTVSAALSQMLKASH